MYPKTVVTAYLLLALPTWVASQPAQPLATENTRAPRASLTGEIAPLQLQPWPARVLITNDDGIDAPGLSALVQAFSPTADIVVVAPTDNRSGSTSYASILSRQVEVETRHVAGAGTAYAVDGYPADCVLIALTGLMVDDPPDLVISGINTGANVGDAWAYSGTLGAARISALHGIPAIAVSGGAPDALAALAVWVVQLAHTTVVRELEPFQYLTVDAPDVPLADIKGVSVVPRARRVMSFGARLSTQVSGSRDVWVRSRGNRQPAPPGTDVDVLADGRIAITTMKADEQDLGLLREIQERVNELPTWGPSEQE